MESGNVDSLADTRCSRLRWKGLYVEIAPDPTVQPGNDQLFWCNRTQTCLGTDGQAVNDFECKTARSCYDGF